MAVDLTLRLEIDAALYRARLDAYRDDLDARLLLALGVLPSPAARQALSDVRAARLTHAHPSAP